MTLLGALTATARPSSCSTDTKLYGIDDGAGGYGKMGPTDTQACFPPNYKPGTSYYYSPASSCPYGYTVGCDPTPTTLVQDNNIVTQIAYTCCPTQQAFSCLSTEDGRSVHCGFDPTTSWSTTITSVYLNGSTKVTPFVAATGGSGYFAFAVQLQAPTSTSLSSESAVSGTSLGSSSSGPSGPGGAGTGGLSTGADVGIGIAVALVGIVAGLLVFLWCRRRRSLNNKKRRSDRHHVAGQDPMSWQPRYVTSDVVHEIGGVRPDQPELEGH